MRLFPEPFPCWRNRPVDSVVQRRGVGALVFPEVSLADLPRDIHWDIQSALRNQRHSLLHERYFCLSWLYESLGESTSRHGRRDEPVRNALGHDVNR